MNRTVKSIVVAASLALPVVGTSGIVIQAAAAEGVKLVKQVAPKYPRGAERRNIEGHVVVGYNIGEDGKAVDIAVVEATPEGVFDDAAMKAVSKWKFEVPAGGANGMKTKISFKL